MTLLLAVLAPFAMAAAAPLLSRLLGRNAGWLLALPPALVSLYFASLLPLASAGAPAAYTAAWAPQLGLHLSLRADGLSLLMALLISGIGALIVAYSGGYLKGHPDLPRFYVSLFLFMGAMLGVVLSDNLLLLFVFWELTSLSSFLLIGFDHDRAEARAAALQALLITSSGGLALLAGLVLLGSAGGTYEISVLVTHGAAVRASPLYLPALALVLLGAFTKSAQFPFHFWLPNAMQAPSPVSAYLHSATMVKAGVYLLARLVVVLGGTPEWTLIVAGVGLVTMLAGGLLSLGQTDLKRMLAYSTVSALGLLVLLIGLGTQASLIAAAVFLIAHALYKGTLFLVAGAIDHETGTRDVRRLSGLFRPMPITAVAAITAALSYAGLPPLLGFIGKELSYELALELGLELTSALFLSGVFFVYVAISVGLRPFLGPPSETPKHAHEAPASMWAGPALLALLSFLIGVAPALIDEPVISPVVSAMLAETVHVHLSLWHGLNPALYLSVVTILLGVSLFMLRGQVRAAASRLAWRWGPDWAYSLGLQALTWTAAWLTNALQSGYLRWYLVIVVVTTTLLSGGTMLALGGITWPAETLDIQLYEVALGALVLFGAIVAVRSYSRLGAVAALGATGFGVGLIYLVFSAPDLAMTQFLVESLTVILFVLVFYHLPHFAHLSPRRTRLRDLVVAISAGTLMTVLVLAAVAADWHPTIGTYFADNAVPGAHGRNIVNDILVDFRGIDTLGEVTVLGIAAVGVFALLKLRKDRTP
jgi:multicomponent Na+:H+ antiporter subunit A